MANAFTRFLGNAADKVGTALHLPELGVSEALSGGNTANTGSKPVAGTSSFPASYYTPQATMSPRPIGPAAHSNFASVPDTSGGADPVTEYLNSLADRKASNPSSGGTSGGSGSSYYMRPQMRTIAGDPRVYNLLDPNDTKDFYAATVRGAEGEAAKQRARLLSDQQTAIGGAKRSYDDQAANLDDSYKTEAQKEADYARGYDTRVADFGHSYKAGMASRQNAFGAANGFQSAQGDSEGLATDAFHRGAANLTAEKASNENGFGLARGALDRNKASLTGNYQDYIKNLQNDVNDKTTALDHYVSEQKANTTSQIAPLNEYNGVKNFDYKLDSYNPTAVHQTDLSSLGAATSFNALSSQQGATGPAVNGFKLPAKQTDPNSEYLDYQKTLKTPEPVKQYLYS